jgi:hypothetical protein
MLANVILVIISRRRVCVGVWQVWCRGRGRGKLWFVVGKLEGTNRVCWYVASVGMGRGILWFVVGKLEGTNNLEVLDFDERIILNESPRKGSILDRDDLSLDADLCQAVVKNLANH